MHLKIKTFLFGTENLCIENPFRPKALGPQTPPRTPQTENSLPTENPLDIYDLNRIHRSFLTFPTKNTLIMLSSIIHEPSYLQEKSFKSS